MLVPSAHFDNYLQSSLFDLAMSANNKLHLFALDLFAMRKFWCGVIIMNHLRPPYGDAFASGLLWSSPGAQALDVPYTYGALRSLRCENDSEAFVVNLFGKNSALEPRIYARGLSLAPADARSVAVFEPNTAEFPQRSANDLVQVPVLRISTTITYMHLGVAWRDVTFEWLSRRLINLLEEQYFQQVSFW